MPKPIKQRELVRRFQKLGWQGPYQCGQHPFLVKNNRRLTIPNPHDGDVDWSWMKRILRQAGVTPQEWENID